MQDQKMHPETQQQKAAGERMQKRLRGQFYFNTHAALLYH